MGMAGFRPGFWCDPPLPPLGGLLGERVDQEDWFSSKILVRPAPTPFGYCEKYKLGADNLHHPVGGGSPTAPIPINRGAH